MKLGSQSELIACYSQILFSYVKNDKTGTPHEHPFHHV